MNIKCLSFAAISLMAFTSMSHATTVVDDDFLINGTQETDASYFGSSNSSAIEFNTNSIGLVSGTSSRQIHGLFETQTLANAGDSLEVTVTFMTPATVGLSSEEIRIGLFDHLDRNTADQLAQNTSYSTAAPNPSFSGLPGFYLELDVESVDPTTDLNIRRSDPSASGRLLSTSTGFTSFGSGPDLGYVFEPNTEYTVTITVTRTELDSLDITTDFGGASYTASDVTPASFSFGMLAMHASSDAFGSSNVVGDDPNVINDNGMDITRFSVEFSAGDTTVIDSPVNEPGVPVFAEVVNDVFAIDGTDQAITDASYFASNSSAAIEFNADSIGLVSGSSTRQIHSLFETQTLGAAGDFVEATITFVTPDTIGLASEDLRIGLFDHLERTSATQLGQNTSYSSSSPNQDYEGLPGFYLELDVESADPATDLDIRRSDPSVSGRLLGTSTGFSSLGNGADIGYVFEPNTEYTVVLKVTRTETNTLDIMAEFDGETFVATDLIPASFNIGMLAINASSGAFGSSNAAGDLDNGIDLTSLIVQSTTTEVDDNGSGNNGSDNGVDIVNSGSGSDVTAVIVGDDFANNGTLNSDAGYFASNTGNAIEFNDNSIGVVSGASGRQIHSVFPTQSLVRVGDKLRATLSFTTPETVAVGGEDIRFGLFDHLGRNSDTELGANTSFSSSNPNDLFVGLPGYYVELDVERFSSQTDLEIGKSNPTETGRLLNTSGGFSRENGPDIGYTIVPNTDYTIYLTVERTLSGLDVTANFLGRSLTMNDALPLSADFGMMALNVSSGAMGTSNVPGEADNGLDITEFNIEFIRSVVVDDNLAGDGTTETDTDYFASSTPSAIEINANSIGLVSGTSSRQIHGLFDTQTLANAGDVLATSITFVTPETVAQTGEDIRIGLFDSLGRTGVDQLGQNTSFSSAEPNLDFADLPGFYLELDVESADPGTDLDIRKSDPSTTGRLLTTTSGFTVLGK